MAGALLWTLLEFCFDLAHPSDWKTYLSWSLFLTSALRAHARFSHHTAILPLLQLLSNAWSALWSVTSLFLVATMDNEAGTLIINFYLLSLATRSYCAKRRPALNFALKLARENRLVSHFHSVPTTSHTLPIVTASLQSSLDDYKATKLILKIVNN